MARPERRRQTGATAVLIALTLTVLVGFLALALNVGHLLSVRGELQNAVDSAAMAGAGRLNGTVERLAQSEAVARAYALEHLTDGQDQVALSATGNGADVVLGNWTAAGGFVPIAGRTAADARLINAVRANTGQPEGIFARAFVGAGETTQVEAMATAASGGASTAPCDTAPLVIREPCLLDESILKCGDPYIMALSPAGEDTAGLSNLIPLSYSEAYANNSSSSASSICEALKNPPPEDCELNAGTTYLETTNGNEISKNCDDEATEALNEKICNYFKKWVSHGNNEPVLVPIPVVRFLIDNKPTECGGQYGGHAQVTGFAMFEITGVYCKGDPDQRTGPCVPFATKQCISATYRCNVPPPVPGGQPGGGWFGTEAVPPALTE